MIVKLKAVKKKWDELYKCELEKEIVKGEVVKLNVMCVSSFRVE